MKEALRLGGAQSAEKLKKKVTGNQRNAVLRKKNEADLDTTPRLPISVCINFGADGKLSAIRFSPESAAKISRAKGFRIMMSAQKRKETNFANCSTTICPALSSAT